MFFAHNKPFLAEYFSMPLYTTSGFEIASEHHFKRSKFYIALKAPLNLVSKSILKH